MFSMNFRGRNRQGNSFPRQQQPQPYPPRAPIHSIQPSPRNIQIHTPQESLEKIELIIGDNNEEERQ